MSDVRPHTMITKDWEDRRGREQGAAEALSLIEGVSLLTDRFGKWPSFEDAEVLSMHFERGNHDRVSQTPPLGELLLPSASAAFHVSDTLYAFEDPRRKASVVTIRFNDLAHLEMDGFNHQNPILGLSLSVEYSTGLKTDLLVVNWGGTGIRHEVSLSAAMPQSSLLLRAVWSNPSIERTSSSWLRQPPAAAHVGR